MDKSEPTGLTQSWLKIITKPIEKLKYVEPFRWKKYELLFVFFFSSLLDEVNLPLYCYVCISERKTLAAQLTRLLLIRIKWVKT